MNSPYDKFISCVEKTDSCWLWKGSKTITGYSRFEFNHKRYSAHRFSYSHYKGEIPDNLVVRHKCKNKCVNPDHLELGTHAENTQDRKRDGTYQYGDKNPRAKLSEEQVKQIREDFPDKSLEDLSEEYKVCTKQIKNIISYKCWNT
jgi:hypothetical protein